MSVILLLGVGEYNAKFITITVVACLIGRACNIFPVSGLLNWKRTDKLPCNLQIQMWHAGLRGAIAYSAALQFPSHHRDMVVNATAWICLFTVFVMGTTTTSTLRHLDIPYNIEQTKEEELAASDLAIRSSRVKTFMAWADGQIQKLIYGKEYMRLMKAERDAMLARTAAASAGASTGAHALAAASTGAASDRQPLMQQQPKPEEEQDEHAYDLGPLDNLMQASAARMRSPAGAYRLAGAAASGASTE